MEQKELFSLLTSVLQWIENNETRIAHAVADIIADIGDYIADDVYLREEIAKAVAMIADEVEEWREKLD